MALKESRQSAAWQQHIKSHQESGLSRPEYCRKHGLKLHQFTYQIQRLQKPSNAAKPCAFARVVVNEAIVSANSLPFSARLVLASGMCIELSPAADPAWIAKLLIQMKGLS